jgi:hypothetical protein
MVIADGALRERPDKTGTRPGEVLKEATYKGDPDGRTSSSPSRTSRPTNSLRVSGLSQNLGMGEPTREATGPALNGLTRLNVEECGMQALARLFPAGHLGDIEKGL